jgi:hypothetical protein
VQCRLQNASRVSCPRSALRCSLHGSDEHSKTPLPIPVGFTGDRSDGSRVGAIGVCEEAYREKPRLAIALVSKLLAYLEGKRAMWTEATAHMHAPRVKQKLRE